MFVKQIYVDWVGVIVDGIVYNGTTSADVTVSLNRQLKPVEPSESEKRALITRLKETENYRILEMIESKMFG